MCAIAATAGPSALLGALWLEHRSAITLPEPTGAYAVGRAIVDWKDEHAIDPMAPVRIAIRGANHFLFSDDGALLKSHLVVRALRPIGMVGIEGRRQLAVTAYCVRSFFDAHLKVVGRAPVALRSPDYPEIEVLE